MAGWTDEMVNRLKELWDEGLTTGEIGKKLNVSKNSIVGKVHRLKLISRPSPIKKKDDEESIKKPEPKKAEIKKAPEPVKEVKKKFEPKIKEEPITCVTPVKKSGDKITVVDLDNHTCRWPIGDPKDENFHFCGKKVRTGQTYCEEHSAIAYVRVVKK